MKKNTAEKICPVCKKPFSWRKKWEKSWNEVRYCSEKCRRNKVKKYKLLPFLSIFYLLSILMPQANVQN